MSELRDLYDENCIRTDNTYHKGDKIPEGYYPMVVMVVIRNSEGKFLMQKRVESKGGDWGVTGGHPKSGETPLEGIITEVKEELGLDFNELDFVEVESGCDGKDCYTMYFVNKDIDIKDMNIQKEELSEVKWFSMDELQLMKETGELNSDQAECFDKACAFIKKRTFEDVDYNDFLIIENYDFSNDTLGNKYINDSGYLSYRKLEGFVKYLEYRKSDNTRRDPDNFSQLLQKVYEKRWDCNDSRVKQFYSDAMTSAQCLIGRFYIRMCALENSDEWKKYKATLEVKPNYPGTGNMVYMYNNLNDFPIFEKIFVKDKEYQYVRSFISLYHTIGNYMPVARYFNFKRSGSGYYDMWDLTLVKIKEYYDAKALGNDKIETKAILDLLHLKNLDGNNKTYFENTESWLKSFNTWKSFVSENYLQDYVNIKGDWSIKDGFTKFHNWEKTFPYNLKKIEYLEYFRLLVKTILSRAKNILESNKVNIEDETK